MEENRENSHKEAKSETITIKKESLWKYSTFVLAAVVIVGFFVMMNNDGGVTGNVVANNPTPTAPQPSAAIVYEPVDPAKDWIKGDADAPVTIIEWSDFECPFCGRFYTQTLGQLESEYIDTGKVKLVFRDFPLSFHPQAMPASQAAECAGAQGMFWEMHDRIFDNQAGLSSGVYSTWAAEFGLDVDAFETCMADPAVTAEINADMADGQKATITGTPGFLVINEDGEALKISGAQPFSAFQTAIEAQL